MLLSRWGEAVPKTVVLGGLGVSAVSAFSEPH
jgi:hypothetical protein